MKNIIIERNSKVTIITIKLSDKTNNNYLEVIKNLLFNKLNDSKYGLKKCEIIDRIGIIAEFNVESVEDLLIYIENIFKDFININMIVVNPKAFKNPHEGIAYFNGAKNLIKSIL